VSAIPCSNIAQCPAPQFCNTGQCTSNELLVDGGRGACNPSLIPNDGCAADGICFASANRGASCVGLPACSQDGTCPAGTIGATCNVRPDGGRVFEGKQRICLVSYCDGPADCPATAPHCVNGNG